MKPVIGLTGGIGSGKSAAADAFAKLGATIVDTDRKSVEQVVDEVEHVVRDAWRRLDRERPNAAPGGRR